MYLTNFSKILGIEEEGGKGHNLKKLVSFGFKVPVGFVVGASFYRDHYPEPPSFDYTDEAKLEEQCLTMQKTVIASPVEAAMEGKILNFLAALGMKSRFAVRSSSTYEDLAEAAFAGQHETYLNVAASDIWQKVRFCFASLWQKHAVLYRNHNHFNQKHTSMAVVIQQMIDPDVSGVAFSVDPVGGNLSHILIEANYGLGESIVSGEAVTDSWIVDKKSGEIRERRIEKKEKRVVSDKSGGVKCIHIDAGFQAVPCLEDYQIKRIAQTIKEIEDCFGAPQDVEWAIVSDEIYITQARPQTKIPPHYTRAESAERFPEPLTPLTWSYVEEAFNISLDYSLNMMGVSLPTRPWFALIDSYVYGNQNAVELLAHFRPLDMSSIQRLEEQIPEMQARFQWIVDLPQYWIRDLDVYLLSIGHLSSATFEDFTMDDYQLFCRELSKTATEYFQPNIAISMTQTLLTRTLFEFVLLLTKDIFKTQDIVRKILASSTTKTGQINREIYGLAQRANKHAGLLQLLKKGGKAALPEIGDYKEFAESFERFLRNYGHREVTFDYYKPTWAEAPHVVLDLIHLAATSEGPDPTEKELDTRITGLAAIQELLILTPDNLRYFANELARLTTTFTWLDDLEHFQTTRLNLLVRKTIGVLGNRFIARGSLEDPYDLFFLKKDEIEGLTDFILPDELKALIKKRKEEYLAAFRKDPLWDLSGSIDDPATQEGTLKGVPGSPGVVEGEVYLVRGVEDFASMPAGTILVARTTNPSWTPLFYKAKGLITESGGPLSHGAVTARELGLPAVMFIRNALQLFRNGDKVRINGQKGVVEKISY